MKLSALRHHLSVPLAPPCVTFLLYKRRLVPSSSAYSSHIANTRKIPKRKRSGSQEQEDEKMQKERAQPALVDCLSFRDLGADRLTSSAHHESSKRISAADRGDKGDDGCEFAFVLNGPEKGDQPSPADEIISDGRIRTLCPVSDNGLVLADGSPDREKIRRLPVEEPQRRFSLDSTSSSEADEIEKIPPETYCVWTPGRCKKSSSMGSLLRWRIRDLMGRRSHSDGKEKFVFLTVDERSGHKKKATKDAPTRSAIRNGRKAAAKAREEEDEEEEEKENGKKKKKKEKRGRGGGQGGHRQPR
ncbi:hypothetical protein MUK42_03401 [Musa troglodytarum]|uniref:Uncharacterized protein n=1 Tax=Musa troglodytarum TaxID=320322 RepID=A0A9E7GYR7_9LILI|nr:hypothetical protein MUK42_03401 [Musa troglodytarum]